MISKQIYLVEDFLLFFLLIAVFWFALDATPPYTPANRVAARHDLEDVPLSNENAAGDGSSTGDSFDMANMAELVQEKMADLILDAGILLL